jgi:predicted dehydrogenase
MAAEAEQKVRVGIIGAGIGQAHIRGYKQVPEAEIVAVCDLNTERAKQVASDQGLDVPIFADFQEMLAKIELDAVSVGVPNTFHRPLAVACMDAGKHVCAKSRWR